MDASIVLMMAIAAVQLAVAIKVMRGHDVRIVIEAFPPKITIDIR